MTLLMIRICKVNAAGTVHWPKALPMAMTSMSPMMGSITVPMPACYNDIQSLSATTERCIELTTDSNSQAAMCVHSNVQQNWGHQIKILTRSSATAKSTARPSCLVSVLYDISPEKISWWLINHLYVIGHESYLILRYNAKYTAITPFKVIQGHRLWYQ